MSEEYNPESLDDMFEASPATQEAVKQEPPQPEEGSTEATKPTEAAPEAPAEGNELTEALSRTEQRLKDTQKWGNEAHQKFLKAQERLHELGEITDEEMAEVRKTVPGTQDEMKVHVDEFYTRYNIVKEFIKDKDGSDPDELVEAFKGVYGSDQQAMLEFAKIPAEKKVNYVLERGREVLDLHKGVKQYGSVAAALAEIRKQAAAAALESVETAKSKKANDSDEETVKAKPRLPQGAGATAEQQYKPQSLTELLE